MLVWIENGEVYAPEYLGKQDILIAGNKIECISKNIDIQIDESLIKRINAEGKIVVPGFIDSHVHIIGGGGEGGFKTRTPEIQLSELTRYGITTVIGCLGTDGTTRGLASLLAKARALEEEGITAYIYTGSYEVPCVTLTGNIREDIILIDKVIGAGEIAISDIRSSQPTSDEIKRIVADARTGGILSGKSGITLFHLGDGKRAIDFLKDIRDHTEIPVTQMIPTHANRNQELFKEIIEYGKQGGLADFTTTTTEQYLEEGETKCSIALKIMLKAGVPIENITFSSDGQGSLSLYDKEGNYIGCDIGKPATLFAEVKDAIMEEGIPLEEAIKVITSNPADILKLPHKGYLRKDYDADLVIMDKNKLEVETVIAKGVVMVEGKEVLVKGFFEK